MHYAKRKHEIRYRTPLPFDLMVFVGYHKLVILIHQKDHRFNIKFSQRANEVPKPVSPWLYLSVCVKIMTTLNCIVIL